MTDKLDLAATRRGFMALAAGGAAAVAATGQGAQAQRVRSQARIVILGAGAGGAAMANRLSRRLDGARITVIDGRPQHWYQPGFTLIAAGLKPASYAISGTTDWLPRDIDFIADYAAEIDPEANSVTTLGGRRVDYDYLIVATGLVLDWDAIEGFDLSMVGPQTGISAHYAGPEHAELSWRALDRFTDQGGKAVFGRPATEMKCAGAPLKITFLAEDIATRKGNRARCSFDYYTPSPGALFGVPVIHHRVRQIMDERQIPYHYRHTLKAIDPVARTATFDTPEFEETVEWDFINIIPPQRAPDAVRNSGLSHPELWSDQGWIDVDRGTLRHLRYSNVFGLGDINAVPKGKTAASVKWHLPVIEDHLVSEIQGRQGTKVFNGYTSCPLITRIGRAMLVEFDYNDNLTPSFPGLIAPLEELWVSWLMKEVALKATYNAMLRGQA